MPRVRRQLSKSKVYHVMVRGNERKKIFLDDADREILGIGKNIVQKIK